MLICLYSLYNVYISDMLMWRDQYRGRNVEADPEYNIYTSNSGRTRL